MGRRAVITVDYLYTIGTTNKLTIEEPFEVNMDNGVSEVPHVEKIDYVGDLSIGYYGVYVTATAPYGQSTKSKTEVGIGLEIIAKVKDRNGADTRDIAHKVAKIFKKDLSKRLNTYIDNITVETRYI